MPYVGANVVKATSAAIELQFTPPDGFVSLMGRLTAFVGETTMAFAEDGEVPGSRQRDMANSGLKDWCDLTEEEFDAEKRPILGG